MPELESKESVEREKKLKRQGYSHQYSRQTKCSAIRLPISLTLSKAGNNSEKLKNKIRQLLFPLYRSKKLTNQISTI